MMSAIHIAFAPTPKVVYSTPWLAEASPVAAEDLAASCRLVSRANGSSATPCGSLVVMLYLAYRISGRQAFYDAATTVLDFARSVLGDDQDFRGFISSELNVVDHELYCSAHSEPPLVTPSPVPGQQIYVIKPGDSYLRIAHDFGVTSKALVAANPQVRWFFGEGPGCAPVIGIGDAVIIPAPSS